MDYDDKSITSNGKDESNNLNNFIDNYNITPKEKDSILTNTKRDLDLKAPPLFREMYKEALDESFEILGEHVSKIVISYIEKKYSINLENTVDYPLLLDDVLQNTIDGGKRIVERKIIKNMLKRLKINNQITINNMSFAETIDELKRRHIEKSRHP